MATKYEGLELVYRNDDSDGATLEVYRGPSLKNYPSDIAAKDAVFYIRTTDLYRFTLKDQAELIKLVLSIVVRPERRKEKAQLFIDAAKSMV